MKVLITAPKGKMGSLIVHAAAKRDGIEIVGGLTGKGRPYIGKDVGIVSGFTEEVGAPVYDDVIAAVKACDVVLDFSTREASLEVLAAAVAHKKGIVVGTTGFSEKEVEAIREASKQIPVLLAPNTSSIVNLMYSLLETATKVVGENADIEIIEMHDRDKLDAPSGTAKEMGQIMAEALGKRLPDLAEYGRSSLRGDAVRKKGAIGYHSIRSGNTPGFHTVSFGFMGERIEITHHAYDWTGYASGACDAALFLAGKAPGMYTMRQVLGL